MDDQAVSDFLLNASEDDIVRILEGLDDNSLERVASAVFSVKAKKKSAEKIQRNEDRSKRQRDRMRRFRAAKPKEITKPPRMANSWLEPPTSIITTSSVEDFFF